MSNAVIVRLPEAVTAALRKHAEADHRSVNNLVVHIVMEWLKKREEPNGL